MARKKSLTKKRRRIVEREELFLSFGILIGFFLLLWLYTLLVVPPANTLKHLPTPTPIPSTY